MRTGLSSESANWIVSSDPKTFTSTLPNHEEELPFRVNREGVKNYIKNRGSLNIGDWAIEGRRMSITPTTAPNTDEININYQPKVLGPDAVRNYTKSRCTTPNLLYGHVEAPDAHHAFRVKREARANYDKNHHSETQHLLENYGKFPVQRQPIPHTQGETATNLFYTHQEGQMGPIINNYGRNSSTPRRVPHVKGNAAEVNREKGHGDTQLIKYGTDSRMQTPEPHVKGDDAQKNYQFGQGPNVNELFHQYGRLPQSKQIQPKVKYDGVQNFVKGQGDDMKKTLSQCPPTSRRGERLQSVPMWP